MTRSKPSWRLVFALLAVATVRATPVHAAERLDRLVTAGLECYEQLNFGCTINKLEAARKRIVAGEALPTKEQLLACESLGFAYASIDRGKSAEESFSWCLKLDPTYTLEEEVVGPRIYPHFDRARRSLVESRLDLAVPPLPWPALVRVEPRPELVVHTPTEILLSGAGGPEPRAHSLGFGAGVSILTGDDANDFDPGLALRFGYTYTLRPYLRVAVDLAFDVHTTARDDVKAGYPSTLLVGGAAIGVEGVATAVEIVEFTGGVLFGGSFAGVGRVSDVVGGLIVFRAGLSVRIGSDFSAGLDVDPTLVIATLSDGSLGTSLFVPVLAHFDARF